MLKPVPIGAACDREPENPGVYQPAGSNNRDDLLLDDKLADAVALHFARHISPALRALNPPRVLLCIGWPGDGKTLSLLALASRFGFDLLQLAGADLCGSLEGAPVEILDGAEAWMRWQSTRSKRPFALLIDDIDASSAEERPDQERTSNSNLLIGKLQAICNSPAQFTTADATPIPLLWTANSTEHFRPSLIRHGRVRVHRHDLDWHTKADMVERIIKPTTQRDRRLLRNLVYRYRTKPIAFFNDLYVELADETILAVVRSKGFDVAAIEVAAAHARSPDIVQLYRLAHMRAEHGGDFNQQRR